MRCSPSELEKSSRVILEHDVDGLHDAGSDALREELEAPAGRHVLGEVGQEVEVPFLPLTVDGERHEQGERQQQGHRPDGR